MPEKPMTPQRRVATAGLSCLVLASIGLPHAFLPMLQASFAAAAISLFYSVALGTLLKEGGARVQFGIGGFVLASLILTSACVGTFFHLPLKLALLYFAVLSVGGAILLTVIGVFLSVKILPDLLEDHSGEQAGDSSPGRPVRS